MKGHEGADTIMRLWQDRLITDEQMSMLASLASEFSKLNDAPVKLKCLSDQLLHCGKNIIRLLEPKSS